jgi:hypothetical protein
MPNHVREKLDTIIDRFTEKAFGRVLVGENRKYWYGGFKAEILSLTPKPLDEKEVEKFLYRLMNEGDPPEKYSSLFCKTIAKEIVSHFSKPNVVSELSDKDMEFVCEQVHKAYCKYHLENKGIEYWTKGDYNKLTDDGKEYDRRTVKAVLEAIHNLITKEALND